VILTYSKTQEAASHLGRILLNHPDTNIKAHPQYTS
jgi:hypothetical protein